jgi:phosphatidylinositol 4-phosphatase
VKANVPQVKYHYFDFHNECKHMRWDRISLLTDGLADDLLRDGCVFRESSSTWSHMPFSYFHLDSKYEEPLKWQLGVVRTNCMDNLDRTNVAQAAFARWTLDVQLKAAGILAEKGVVDQHEEIDIALRESTKRTFTVRFSMLTMTLQCGRSTPISFPKHTLDPGL